MLVDLVQTTTNDGLRLDGMLEVPSSATPDTPLPADAVLCLHGVAGNFYSSSLLAAQSQALREQGLAVLRVNTRGHDAVHTAATVTGSRLQGAAYEIVDECRYDVAAWCQFLSGRGYQRLLLLGHSLGALKALYAQAYEPQPNVMGLALLSPPRLSYSSFCDSKDEQRFRQTVEHAQQLVEQGKGDALMQVGFPFPLLITATAYLDKYGPQERYNIERFIARVRRPLLCVYGQQELTGGAAAFSGLAERLPALVPQASRLAVVTLPGADHFYRGAYESLANHILGWFHQLTA